LRAFKAIFVSKKYKVNANGEKKEVNLLFNPAAAARSVKPIVKIWKFEKTFGKVVCAVAKMRCFGVVW
jgi:hypothetical protein